MRRRHDSLSKELLDLWFAPLGAVVSSRRVHGEERHIDLVFTESPTAVARGRRLRRERGALGELARGTSAIEAFRNACTASELRRVFVKLMELHEELQREARRERRAGAVPLPRMWVLTPTLSEALREDFGMTRAPGLFEGVLAPPNGFGTKVVVLSELEEVPETLWLRLLARGQVQARAMDELARSGADHPLRGPTIRRVLRWRTEAEGQRPLTEIDKEHLMNSERLVQEWERKVHLKGKAEGLAKGEAKGLAEGKAKAIVAVLRTRGLHVTAKQLARIEKCDDLVELDRWLVRAVTVAAVEEVFAPARRRAAAKVAASSRSRR